MNLETRQAYSEVNKFLELIGEELASELPIKLRKFFEREMDKSYIPIINPDKPITEQNLKRKTIAIIAGLNINYWCKDEERKKELLETYYNNEIIHQKQLREKYNPDDIFKNKYSEPVIENNNLPIEVEKETFFKKIVKFIKNLFRKN